VQLQPFPSAAAATADAGALFAVVASTGLLMDEMCIHRLYGCCRHTANMTTTMSAPLSGSSALAMR